MQAIGATTPFFTAVLGFLLLAERETPMVYLSLVPVVGGANPRVLAGYSYFFWVHFWADWGPWSSELARAI
jgi:hypothetical protein